MCPVSTSTSTSANVTPCVLLSDNHRFHVPCTISPASESVAQACLKLNDFPPPDTVPSAKTTSSGLHDSSGATRLAISTLALYTATLVAPASDGAIVDPPDPPDRPYLELPISSFTSSISSP